MNKHTGFEIAVIGMAGRFPGAADVNAFWNNLQNGVESISFFTDEELLSEGENAETINNPLYVRAHGFVEQKEYFDSSFFGYRPDEAGLMDPQMRVLHECVWQAIEDAGYDLKNYKGKIGLFTGARPNLNWENYSIIKNQQNLVDEYSANLLSNAALSNTRISYLLNLSGPSVSVYTTCSTSLVAIHQACNSLLLGECTIAVAGGISLANKSKKGYLYEDGMIFSRDGHCRAFDAEASGTIDGEGAGLVVLKRLKHALADGDNILAVIKGTGINNDGNEKIGYTAPGVNGQAQAIMMSRKMAGVEAESISYVETHGTATKLGDPIEIEALIRAFGKSNEKYCALGAVKTNIGHLDTAAGVAGFIKTVLALKNRKIPPSLHFKTPNPNINFDNSPFYVNTSLKEWRNDKYPLRAGVSSFGIGGTNAHIILEEAPEQPPASPGRQLQLLLFSAKTLTALERNIENFTSFLKTHPDVTLPDVAYTLQTGRSAFAYRKMIVCGSGNEALALLETARREDRIAPAPVKANYPVVFMFPGQGVQYVNMCYELYNEEEVFRAEVDKCFDIVNRISGKDLAPVVFNSGMPEEVPEIDKTEFTQPLLFIMEYALAQLLMKWGISPDIMIGHSIGEYVAACISGVFSLEDALMLVTRRGELMQRAPAGVMLSVAASENELQSLLATHDGISLAAVNSSELCVVAGTVDRITHFSVEIANKGYKSKLIHTSHAFHSHLMEGMLADFEKELAGVKTGRQHIPFISNVSGETALDDTITQPGYWVRQLRETVRFSKGLETLLLREDAVFIEVGPGRTLSTFVKSHKLKNEKHKVISLLGPSREKDDDLRRLLSAIGELWLNGITPDWKAFYEKESRRRVSLPAYSFDRIKYPANVDAFKMVSDMIAGNPLSKNKCIADWLYAPSWKLAPFFTNSLSTTHKGRALVFADDCGISDALISRMRENGEEVIVVKTGSGFRELSPLSYEIKPAEEKGYGALFSRLSDVHLLPDRIIHGWSITGQPQVDFADLAYDTFFYSLLHIVRSCQAHTGMFGKQLVLLTNDLHHILGTSSIASVKSLSPGLLKVVSQEYPGLCTGHIDISLSEELHDNLYADLYKEIAAMEAGKVVAFRQGRRWERIYDRIGIKNNELDHSAFRKEGVYLITGGLGNLGFNISRYLLTEFNAKLILLGRTKLPAASEREQYGGRDGLGKDITRKLERLSLLEQAGQVLYFDIDITDAVAFAKALSIGQQRLGPVNGVIHAASIADDSTTKPISELTKEDFKSQFAPKIGGLQVLKESIGDKALDFCLVASSLSAILGGLGFGAYGPANACMDHYINAYRERGELQNWISVNFDGIDFDRETKENITGKELFEVIDRVLAVRALPQVVVSASDLHKRLEKWVYRNGWQEEEDALSYGQLLSEETTSSGNVILSNTEESLVALWRKFFGKAEITVNDDFFEIGGDSLKALTMISRIHKMLNVEISIKDFFDRATIKELAAYIDSTRPAAGGKDKYIPIPQAAIKEYYSLSSAQKRLYFLYELDKTSIAYNAPTIARVNGELDRDRLVAAFNKLVARHESLRTVFGVVNGEPVQRIITSASVGVTYFQSTEEEAPEIIKEFIRPFDLTEAPLIRVGLVSIAAQTHILMVDLHHIITDGVSQSILMRDFAALYNNEQLPALQLQYKDYTEWQHSDDQQEQIARQRQFWLDVFSEELPVPELPTDFARPAMKSYEGSSIDFKIHTAEASKLKSVAEMEGATIFMALLAIYNILLSKLSNEEDIVIGVPTAGRPHFNLENIVGVFVNTLPLRNFPKGDLNFREFLRTVKSRTLESFDNQSYPYEVLIDELKVARDTSHNPLFDAMFVFQNVEDAPFEIPGLTISVLGSEHAISKFDMTLSAYEKEGEILLNFEYSTKLFKKERIERFIEYLERIVAAVVSDSNIRISDIDLLSARERNMLLNEFNATACDYPESETLVSLFERQVRRTPDHVAVRYKQSSLSYRELKERSDKIACYLQKQAGLRKGDFVGLMLDREEYLIPCIFGILKAGGVYVPISPEYPSDRVRSIVDNSGLNVVITRGGLAQGYKSVVATVVDLDEEQDMILSYPVREPFVTVTSSDLAYVIYTSGSTGTPKGVMIAHQAVVNRILWMQKAYAITEDDVLLQKTPITFDVSIWEIFWWAFTGASLCLLSPGGEKDPEEIIATIEMNKVSVIHFVPSMLDAFMTATAQDVDFKALKSLRQVFTSGEALKVEQVEWFGKTIHKFWGAKLINLYGPTEATVDVSYYECSFDRQYSNIPIGKPIDNIRLYIVDKHYYITPPGVAGELCIAGVGLARGYVHNKALTEDRFIENPNVPGEVMYRTGDLARWLPDGNIAFLGRIDHQVKIRGYRIEPGEIEHVLLESNFVRQAVVVTGTDSNHHKRLLGYIVPVGEFRKAEILSYLKSKLPGYMIPTLVALGSLPLSSSGKIDRKLLPDPFGQELQEDAYVAPRNELEKSLAGIWQNLLGVQKIGIYDNFFELGGHSLIAVHFIAVLKQELDISIPVRLLFQWPNIALLANFLQQDITEGVRGPALSGF